MKYAPRKVYIKESGGYVELSYTDFCRRRQADKGYMDKLFIPVQGCLLEVVREQYADFYRDRERWRYLQKLDARNSLLYALILVIFVFVSCIQPITYSRCPLFSFRNFDFTSS